MGNICPQNKNPHHGRSTSYLERHESGFKGYNGSSAGTGYPIPMNGPNGGQTYRDINNGMIIINGPANPPINHINGYLFFIFFF